MRAHVHAWNYLVMAGMIEAMRGWGLVDEDELKNTVIISPHLDDAVLGCSYLMLAHPGATVITLFCAAPDVYTDPVQSWDALAGFRPGDRVHDARMAEDVKALATFDATPIHLKYLEHTYLEFEQWVKGEDMADELETQLEALGASAIFAPFGIANPDHVATHRASMIVRDRMLAKQPDGPKWYLYEDTGYKHIPGQLAGRIAELYKNRVWPTPACPRVIADPAAKLEAFLNYSSQINPLNTEWRLLDKLDTPVPEQYWSLAAPPHGWMT
jgi:LmbE family N-acetylglucosaminyl deacetylase